MATPVERTQASLAACEEQLAEARTRYNKLTADLARVSVRADQGDKHARIEQAPLNKAIAAEGRLVASLTRQAAELRKWRDMAVAQAAHATRLAAVAADADKPREKLYEVRAADGRVLRHWRHSPEALRADLLPGYVLTAEVFGADADGKGGFAAAIGTGTTFMAALLAAHGDELRAFLRNKP